jgi:hypothetical protein
VPEEVVQTERHVAMRTTEVAHDNSPTYLNPWNDASNSFKFVLGRKELQHGNQPTSASASQNWSAADWL